METAMPELSDRDTVALYFLINRLMTRYFGEEETHRPLLIH
jgi:hypothetical protein